MKPTGWKDYMKGYKKLAIYGSRTSAKALIAREKAHGATHYLFRLTATEVGRSVDKAYSDKNGMQWTVWYKLKG
jgi:hypothetical protein